MSFQKDKSYKWILLPIETKIREFHAKVLLACIAAESGFAVILWTLGESKRQKWRFLPRGICLEKSIVKANAKKFSLLRKYGNKVCAWCEEGLVLLSRKEYQQRRINEDAVDQVDLFFAWGDYQADAILDKAPSVKDRMRVYGNPRIDILRQEFRSIFDDDADLLKKQHGEFILINTNFSLCNHVKGTEAVINIFKKSGKIQTEEQEVFYNNWIEYKAKLHREFVALVKALSLSYPRMNVIVRPHPSENFESWRKVTKYMGNVRVIHEGNVIPWLMAAKVVIHNGCTTGLEAYLLDRPVIVYQPIISSKFDFYLPNSVSRKTTSIDNLIETIHLLFTEGEKKFIVGNSAKQEIVEPYLKGVEGAFASEQIVEALKQIDVTPQPFKPSLLRVINRLWFKLWLTFKYTVRDIKDRLIQVGNQHNENSSRSLLALQKRYSEQKFPGMTLQEVQETIGKLQNVSGRFSLITVEEIGENCFVIK